MARHAALGDCWCCSECVGCVNSPHVDTLEAENVILFTANTPTDQTEYMSIALNLEEK